MKYMTRRDAPFAPARRSYSGRAGADTAANGAPNGANGFCFLCPLCAEVGTLVSDGDAIRCAACGPLAILDEYYALRWVAKITPQSPATTPFAHLAQWNAWQREHWRERLKRAAKCNGRSDRNGEAGTDLHAAADPNAVGNTADPHATANSPLLPSERAIVKTGYRQQPLTTLGVFDMWLSADGILHYRSAARRRMDAPAPLTAARQCNRNRGMQCPKQRDIGILPRWHAVPCQNRYPTQKRLQMDAHYSVFNGTGAGAGTVATTIGRHGAVTSHVAWWRMDAPA